MKLKNEGRITDIMPFLPLDFTALVVRQNQQQYNQVTTSSSQTAMQQNINFYKMNQNLKVGCSHR